jgi:hypothetical protein
MGWRDCHLYMFRIEGKEYGIPDRDWDAGRKLYDARRYALARLFPKLPSRFEYVYDFGDCGGPGLGSHVIVTLPVKC